LPFPSLLFELETYTNSSSLWIGCVFPFCVQWKCLYLYEYFTSFRRSNVQNAEFAFDFMREFCIPYPV
jgi:hypothetical protein